MYRPLLFLALPLPGLLFAGLLYGKTVKRAKTSGALTQSKKTFLVLACLTVAFALASAFFLIPSAFLPPFFADGALLEIENRIKTLEQVYLFVSLLVGGFLAYACVAGTRSHSAHNTRYQYLGTGIIILYLLFILGVIGRYENYLAIKHTLSVGG